MAKWNQIDPKSPLYVGTSIYLYDAKPQNSETSVSMKSKAQPETYLVQANDTLTGVAGQFGLSVKQLADFNNLPVSSGLRVGQKLSLKEMAQSNSDLVETKNNNSKSAAKVKTRSYVVKRGEYLKLIADRYALSNQELADLTSGLTAGSSLMVGQKINVPLYEAGSQPEEKASPVKIDPAGMEPSYKTENYQVQRGDTLSSIAGKSKISLTELTQLNKLSGNSGIRVGQTLKIPASSTVPESYTVQSGDSLSAISAKYNLGVDYIANINGINRNTGLRVGQRLKLSGEEIVAAVNKVEAKIEKVSFEKSVSHVVKPGETLSNIAKKYHLQLDYLAALNGLTRNATVRIGQRLKIEGDLPQLETKAEVAVTKAVKSSKIPMRIP